LQIVLTFSSLAALSLKACTVFVLTDTNATLFCDNEDWSNQRTRIWFVTGDGHYGRIYVGFDNGWAQGGMNTEGLAFGWVAGYTNSNWKPDPKMKSVRGNPSERMLESCASVAEAVTFYQTHQESGFSYAKTLIADRTGASVIIEAVDGKLQFTSSNGCQGFGVGDLGLGGRKRLGEMLATAPKPTLFNATNILHSCVSFGIYATKYSHVLDLKSGDIFLFPFPDKDDLVKFNLLTELKKGPHYFDMPAIYKQLQADPLPLVDNMKGPPLEWRKPIPDENPEVTAHLRAMLQHALAGKLRAVDYTSEMWKEEAPKQEETRKALESFGQFVSLAPVDYSARTEGRSYRYKIDFEKAVLLMHFVFDKDNKLALSVTEDAVMKE
jgi:hypothetical protein